MLLFSAANHCLLRLINITLLEFTLEIVTITINLFDWQHYALLYLSAFEVAHLLTGRVLNDQFQTQVNARQSV